MSERETFSSSGVALERPAFLRTTSLGVPPTPLVGFKFSNRNADDASGRALARMNAAQTAAQQHAQTANDALVYVRTVKLRVGRPKPRVRGVLDIMGDDLGAAGTSLSLDSPKALSLSLSRRAFF